MAYTGTFGIHFPIHQPGWLELTAPAYVDLAGRAQVAGFETVWANDNFKARHTFSLLGAVAARHHRARMKWALMRERPRLAYSSRPSSCSSCWPSATRRAMTREQAVAHALDWERAPG